MRHKNETLTFDKDDYRGQTSDIAKLRCKMETADPILQLDTSQLKKSLEEVKLKLNELYAHHILMVF